MAELKTKENDADVQAFLDGIDGDDRQADCKAIAALMGELTGAPARMWGKTIVGFGHYHYRTGLSFATSNGQIRHLKTLQQLHPLQFLRDSLPAVGRIRAGELDIQATKKLRTNGLN